jgi:hypothetical protein
MVHETVSVSGHRLNQRQWNRAILLKIKKLSKWNKTKEPKGIKRDKMNDL